MSHTTEAICPHCDKMHDNLGLAICAGLHKMVDDLYADYEPPTPAENLSAALVRLSNQAREAENESYD